MKNKIIAFISLWALVLAFWSYGGPNLASAGNPQRVIVTFEHAVNEAVRQALEAHGGKVLKELRLVNGTVVILPSEAAVSEVGALSGVKRIEPDVRVFAIIASAAAGGQGKGGTTPPPQPAQVLPWGVDRIDAELVWASRSRGTGVKVAVIDTGIDKDHADLAANLRGGVNFVSKPWWQPADPVKWDDDNGHGTHVAGTIGAANNAIGVVGVAPEVHLYAVKVLDRNGSGYVSDVIDGVSWALNNGMQVINMSLGTASDIQAMHDAVDAAYNAGLVLVAAAGNSGDGNANTNEVLYPAKYSSVIAVSATASDDSVPYWSSSGPEVELAAPGVSILSTWNDGLYKTISGTSMASPHVAGTAALVLATAVQAQYDFNFDGLWNPGEVRAVLRATADDFGAPGHDNFYGYGLVDAEESVTGVQTHP